MARPGNRHCVNCIGTLSFPIVHLSLYSSIWIRYKKIFTRLCISISTLKCKMLSNYLQLWQSYVILTTTFK